MLTDLQYYKPWELLPEHEDQIKRQIEEAQAIVDDELDEIERSRGRHETPLRINAPSKISEETMADAPTTASLEGAEGINEKKEEEEPDVSTLNTKQPDEAITESAPEPQPQHDEIMEEEPATAGAAMDKKASEEGITKTEENATVKAEEEAQAKMEEDAKIKAEREAQVEAEMIDEHRGETIVEAEEDTVIY